MSSIVLLVFEGEKTEPQLFRSIETNFFQNLTGKTILKASFCGEIFQLWSKLKDDPDFDVVELLLDRGAISLTDLEKKSVAEIFLFFDLDAHSHPEIAEKDYYSIVGQMLETFDNETEQGKLFLSYPMVEAIKDIQTDAATCVVCTTNVKNGKSYKADVGTRSDYKSIQALTGEDWLVLSSTHVQKALALVRGSDQPFDQAVVELLDQHTIYKIQLSRFLGPTSSVAILSAFPLFLVHYFGASFLEKLMARGYRKTCGYSCVVHS
jgi:hypothetical protein